MPIWAVPAGFLALGHWPFGLIAALALTLWVLAEVPRHCPHCGQRLD